MRRIGMKFGERGGMDDNGEDVDGRRNQGNEADKDGEEWLFLSR